MCFNVVLAHQKCCNKFRFQVPSEQWRPPCGSWLLPNFSNTNLSLCDIHQACVTFIKPVLPSLMSMYVCMFQISHFVNSLLRLCVFFSCRLFFVDTFLSCMLSDVELQRNLQYFSLQFIYIYIYIYIYI